MRGAVLAAGHPWRSRSRRGGLPHRRSRQGAASPHARGSMPWPARCSTPLQRRMLAARRALAARGLNEAVTWSFLPEAQAELFGGGAAGAQARQSDLVRTVRHAALAAAQSDRRSRAQHGARLCRYRRCSRSARPMPATGRQDETLRAAGVRRGAAGPRHWQAEARAVDVFDAKADALAVLDAAARTCRQLSQIVAGGPPWYPSRPLRHDPARPEEQAWLVSAKSIRACCRRWMCRDRCLPSKSSSMPCPSRGGATAHPAGARSLRPHAGQARLRLRGR